MPEPIYKPIQKFEPLDWQQEPLRYTGPVMLLTGSAGGGKSKTWMEKAHAFALTYKGATVVAFRKKREDAKKSFMLALKHDVIGPDPRVTYRASDFIFSYDNGSVIIVAGLKDENAREALRSIGIRGGIDLAILEEGIEYEESDFNEVVGRMRGNAAPWRQVIVATNPGPPTHWINRRLIIGGEARVFLSDATMNPHNPPDYLTFLHRMTGVEAARLVKGLWIVGTGLVIDTWKDHYDKATGNAHGGNVTENAEYIPGGGEVILAADDGYAGEFDKKTQMFTDDSHPRVFLLIQKRYDGQFACFAELYRIKTLATTQLAQLKDICKDNGWPFPKSADRDKAAAALGGELEKAGIKQIRLGPSSREESIKVYKAACAADENGWRRFIVHPRCHFMRLEMNSWSLDNSGNPMKAQDNGPDAARYFCWNHIIGHLATDVASAQSITDKEKMDELMAHVAAVYRKHMEAAAVKMESVT